MKCYNLLNKSLIYITVFLFFGTVIVSGVNENVNHEICAFNDLIIKTNFDSLVNITSIDFNYKNRDEFYIPRNDYVDQQQLNHGSSGLNINYGQFVAQSFKPSVNRLSKVNLKLFKYNGVPDYDLEFSVRSNLNGADLVKVTKSGSQVINGWNEFDIPDLQVQVDMTYYLVCEGDDGHGDDPIYCWYNNAGNPYARGMVHIFNYGSWHDVASTDCCFMTYYTNFAPNSPSISGPTSGKTGKNYDFKFMSFDQDGDDVYIYIDWGDDYIEDWIGPFGSAEEITRSHKWEDQGTFIIKAKAKDTFNMESSWASFEVEIPRNRVSNLWYQWFLERFPMLERLLSLIRVS